MVFFPRIIWLSKGAGTPLCPEGTFNPNFRSTCGLSDYKFVYQTDLHDSPIFEHCFLMLAKLPCVANLHAPGLNEFFEYTYVK